MWQDIIMSIASIGISYALIPQIIRGFENYKAYIDIRTSLITTICMILITVSMFGAGLFMAGCIDAFISTMWGVLLWQSYRFPKAFKRKK